MKKKFNKYDEVQLTNDYENRTVYIVIDTNDKGIVSIGPKRGGFIVSADQKNLVRV